MGLFTNKKKLCPICGSPTPRLLPTKIEGAPICSACADKIDLPSDRVNNLTMSEFQSYLEFYDGENARLREQFQETYSRSSRFFSNIYFICDSIHQLFKVSNMDNAIVFPGDCLKQLTILEDDRILMELTPQSLHIYHSPVPEFIDGMTLQIEAFNRERERYEFLERQRENMERLRNDRDDGSVYSPSYSEPRFYPALPFEKFHIELVMEHPWGHDIKEHEGVPAFDSTHPSAYDYMENYNRQVAELRELILAFRDACCPNCEIIEENDTRF